MKANLIDQLKNISLINNSYEDYFKEIAKNMFENYCIKKGKDIYYFTSLEFYFCHKNHLDIITYPRITKAGQWFFHQSGVDLTFESRFSNISKYNYKPIVSTKEEFAYGGILIKNLVRKGDGLQLKGPCISMWELFDVINAIPDEICDKNGKRELLNANNWPVITTSVGYEDIEPESKMRELRLNSEEQIVKKFKSLNKEIFNNEIPQTYETEFVNTIKKTYRFEVPADYYR